MHRRYGFMCTALILCLAGGVLADPLYPSLWECFDTHLQDDLEYTLQRLGLRAAIRRKQLSVALVDITDLARPRVAAVNGDEMFYAASLPKIAILLGAFVLIEKGDMTLDVTTREALTRMIRASSNEAATQMLHRIGKSRLARILQSERFRLYDPAMNGGLWVGKDYSKTPAWKRDPLYHLSHGATAMQTARFYYLLETQQLVSPQLSHSMKEILSRPAIHHKFVKGLEARPGSKMYRKSGTWQHWHADSAIVERDGYKYIVVALAHHPHAGQWLSRLIVPLDDLIVPAQP
jgi:beta-lactamase class A